ncbi:MAG: hypothetical protein WKF84_14890 [Pyrinomonadaceae bacterium]
MEVLVHDRTGLRANIAGNIVDAFEIALWLALAFVVVRAVNELIFGIAFRKRKGYEAPDLIRNIFSRRLHAGFCAHLSGLLSDFSGGALYYVGRLRRNPRSRASVHAWESLRGHLFSG